MPQKIKYVLLIGVLIIATFFRFYHITTTPPGLYPDEAMDGANAQNVAQTGQYKVYYPEDNGREGLYVNILAIAFKYHLLPETAPWSVRIPAAVAGTLTVLGLYLLVLELFKEERYEQRDKSHDPENSNLPPHTSYLTPHSSSLALLAAFFLATSFWHINFSRIGFRAILAPLLLTWTSYLLLKAFRSKGAIGYWLLAILSGILYGLGFYTYIAFRITPLLLLLFIPFFRKTADFWKKFFGFVAATVATALPISWYYMKHPADFFGRTSQISISNSKTPLTDLIGNIGKTASMFTWHGDYNWRQNISGAPELWWPVGILFLVGIVLGIGMVVHRKRFLGNTKDSTGKDIKKDFSWSNSHFPFSLVFLFAWFILGALPEVLSDEGIPHALRSLLMVIPTMIFAAIGGIAFYHLISDRWSKKAAMVLGWIFIIATVISGYRLYFITWAKNPNVPGAFSANYVVLGNEINALPASVQKYVVVQAGGVIDYGMPVPATTVMYVTNSFVPDAQAQKDVNNIHYLLPNEITQIPKGTPSSTIFYIR
jgi:4-amino-4-deoxy-L-arabinose transferase-like glycosyltransferase